MYKFIALLLFTAVLAYIIPYAIVSINYLLISGFDLETLFNGIGTDLAYIVSIESIKFNPTYDFVYSIGSSFQNSLTAVYGTDFTAFDVIAYPFRFTVDMGQNFLVQYFDGAFPWLSDIQNLLTLITQMLSQ